MSQNFDLNNSTQFTAYITNEAGRRTETYGLSVAPASDFSTTKNVVVTITTPEWWNQCVYKGVTQSIPKLILGPSNPQENIQLTFTWPGLFFPQAIGGINVQITYQPNFATYSTIDDVIEFDISTNFDAVELYPLYYTPTNYLYNIVNTSIKVYLSPNGTPSSFDKVTLQNGMYTISGAFGENNTFNITAILQQQLPGQTHPSFTTYNYSVNLSSAGALQTIALPSSSLTLTVKMLNAFLMNTRNPYCEYEIDIPGQSPIYVVSGQRMSASTFNNETAYTVSGYVVDANTQKGLSANIVIYGQTFTTNKDGSFNFTVQNDF
ncbi:MAG: hypothetical protein QXP36_04080, partial [Conexivisphaerales archaeon]